MIPRAYQSSTHLPLVDGDIDLAFFISVLKVVEHKAAYTMPVIAIDGTVPKSQENAR